MVDGTACGQSRRKLTGGIGAAALLLPLALATTGHAATFAPEAGLQAIENNDYIASYPSEFRSQVNADTIWGHDYELSVEIGPRVAGTPAEDAAADYVAGLFEAAGFEVERETFQARSQSYADVVPSRYTDEYASWQFRPLAGSHFTGPTSPVMGDVVDVGDGTDPDLSDVAGKIALADWEADNATRDDLLRRLQDAGAAAIVLAQTDGAESPPSLPRGATLPEELADAVIVTAATNQGVRIRTLLDDGPLNLTITTEQSRETSTNVIGTLPAASGDPDAPIIYIGSHMDSVVGSPGASDNGSGVSIMLEVARIIRCSYVVSSGEEPVFVAFGEVG